MLRSSGPGYWSPPSSLRRHIRPSTSSHVPYRREEVTGSHRTRSISKRRWSARAARTVIWAPAWTVSTGTRSATWAASVFAWSAGTGRAERWGGSECSSSLPGTTRGGATGRPPAKPIDFPEVS
jgi:hypothetical protein